MAAFTIRIELYNGSTSDYERLHLAMSQYGFLRTIVADSGDRYALPTAEYNYEGLGTINDVLGNAQKAVAQSGRPAGIFVTEAVRRLWIGLPTASPLVY